MKLVKKMFCFCLVLFLGVVSMIPINANADTGYNIITINAKKDRGEGVNKFNYFPESKWKYDGVADEVFTNVDTTLSENHDVYYTVTFHGTGVEIWGYKAPRHAKVSFSVDDGVEKIVDTYSSQREFVKLIEFKDLDNEQHIVKAKATGEKNPSAAAGDIQVTEARIYQPKKEATNVTFLDEEVSMYVEDTYQVRYELDPADSKLPSDFYFTSADETIAEVDKITGLVTAHKPGEVIINGTCQSLGIYAHMKIKVAEKGKIHSTIVDSNDQYKQDEYQYLLKTNVKNEFLWAWKNDKAISEIAVLATDEDLSNVSVEIGEFKNENGTSLDKNLIEATQIKEATGFIGNAGYSFNNPEGIMPTGPKDQYFDILYSQEPFDIEKNKFSLIWLDFNASKNTEPGIYTGTISITADGLKEKQIFHYTFEVINAELSNAEDYNFRPDYWTYPFSSAEYYDVEPFSEEHLAILKDHLLEYKAYGGTTITGTLIEEAWGGQTYGEMNKEDGDIVRTPSLIKWTKKADGSWEFDYTYLDKYVELAKSIGIGDDIVLYSPMPWNDQVTYYDEKTSEMKKETVSTSNKEEYSQFWLPFFKDFANHLDEKGWFDDVSLGFDERPNMKLVFDVIDTVTNKDGKVFKKQGAYNNIYSGDGVPERMDNLSYNLNQIRLTGIDKFKQFVAERKAKGLKTTTYTGTDIFPNTFLRSIPAEGYWTMMFSGSLNLDGFLDWAYDAWVEDPLRDTTHFAFQAGDCFMVYPSEKNANTKVSLPSIRSEKYDEGVRDINKLYLMKQNCPELSDEIDSLFSRVKPNYEFEVVENEPGWMFNNGKPARWITENGKAEMLSDVEAFKEEIYEISKIYEESITEPDESIKLELETDKVDLKVGETYRIKVTITPENAADQKLVYTSQNPEIASVDSEGYVKALKAGKAVIIVSDQNHQVEAAFNVNVVEDSFANKDILYSLLEKYKGYSAANYTEETWTVFKEAYDKANSVYKDENAAQKDVDQAVKALEDAYNQLILAEKDNEVDKPTDSGETTGDGNHSDKEQGKTDIGDTGTETQTGIFLSLVVMSGAAAAYFNKRRKYLNK